MSTNQDWQQTPPPPKSGMSGGTKLLLILGGIGGLLALVCCGGIGFVVFKYRNAMSTDPATVRATTSEIATIAIPDGFTPVMSMNLPWPPMKMATYQDSSQQGMIVLMEMDASMGGADPEQMRIQMQQQLRQQGQPQADVQVQQSETRQLTVRGQPTEFVFSKGTNTQTNTEFWQVTGTFQSQGGTALLIVMVPADQMTEEEIVEFIESIQ